MNARTRTRDGLTLGLTWQEDSINTSCTHTTRTYGTPSNILHMGTLETMTDTVVPDFLARKRKGETFFNDLHQEFATYTESYTNGEIRSVADSCGTAPGQKASWFCMGAYASRVVDKILIPNTSKYVPVVRWNSTQAQFDSWVGEACTEMLAQRGYPPQSNLWESLAEARKTAEMLNRPMLQLIQRLQKVIRARTAAQKVADSAKIAADYWLLYRYGLKPLIMDITSIISGLDKVVGKVRQTSRSSTMQHTSTVNATNNAATGVVNWTIGIQTTESSKIRAMALDEYTATIGSNIGFTSKALLTTPYELLAYSFVADWFFNIGDYLNAIVPALGWTALGSCYTSEVVRTTVWTPVGGSSNHSGYTIFKAPEGVISGTIRSKDRLPIVSPKLVVVNDFKFDKLTRQIDAAALIGQLVYAAFAPKGASKERSRFIQRSHPTRKWSELHR